MASCDPHQLGNFDWLVRTDFFSYKSQEAFWKIGKFSQLLSEQEYANNPHFNGESPCHMVIIQRCFVKMIWVAAMRRTCETQVGVSADGLALLSGISSMTMPPWWYPTILIIYCWRPFYVLSSVWGSSPGDTTRSKGEQIWMHIKQTERITSFLLFFPYASKLV